MSEAIKIAGVQMDVALGGNDHNLARIADAIRETSRQGAMLAVFPECAVTGYCFESLEEAWPSAEPIPGPGTDRLAGVCHDSDTYAVVGMLEADGGRMFNASVLIGPQGVIGWYRKAHLPMLGIDQFTTPGDRPFRTWHAGPLRIGMNICYDGSFPEASRIMALAGADLIALPTNWPAAAEAFARHAINTRAIENHVYYISVNRVGTERDFPFIGLSRICSPLGQTLAEADHDREEILYAEIEPELARQKHLVRVPGKHEIHRFRDRRPDLYGPLADPGKTD